MSFCTNQSLTVTEDWWFRVELQRVMVLKAKLFSACFFLSFASVPPEEFNCVTAGVLQEARPITQQNTDVRIYSLNSESRQQKCKSFKGFFYISKNYSNLGAGFDEGWNLDLLRRSFNPGQMWGRWSQRHKENPAWLVIDHIWISFKIKPPGNKFVWIGWDSDWLVSCSGQVYF